jgi:hypothetical protein
MEPQTLPFGRHRGTPLPEVPAGYLRWLLAEAKLSSGLRTALAAELQARGVEVPPAPPRKEPRCDRHPAAGFLCSWLVDAIGRRHVRATCATCGRRLGFVPATGEYAEMADAALAAVGRAPR